MAYNKSDDEKDLYIKITVEHTSHRVCRGKDKSVRTAQEGKRGGKEMCVREKEGRER